MTQLKKNVPEKFVPSDPWKGDKLDRQSVADFLTPVIASIRQPFVIGLHSAYGTGKTDFLNRWGATLETDGYKVVRFNAWETDFSQDALSAFVSALKRNLGTDDEKKRGYIELAKSTGGFALKRLFPLLVKTGVKHVIGDEGTEEAADILGISESQWAGFAEGLAQDALMAQEQAEESMESFKKTLEALIEREVKSAKDKDHEKVLIFIDELDRCRPDYAVQVLETVKHFFSVKGVVFIIAIDDEQLRSSIASVYGPGLNADGYLRRFIDIQIQIPKPPAGNYIDFLCKEFELDTLPFLRDGRDWERSLWGLKLGFSIVTAATSLPLRNQEQCFTHLNLYLRSLPENEKPFMFCLGLVAALRLSKPALFEEYMSGKLSFNELLIDLEDKLKLATEELHEDWQALRLIMHSLFLTESHRSDLYDSIEYERHHETELSDDNIHYLETVISFYDSDRSRGRGFKNGASVAQFIGERLTLTERFSR